MARFANLPQLTASKPYLTEAGLETTLVFREGVDLPHFASFPLLSSEDGRRAIEDCYRPFFVLASQHGTGLVIETPTWRANRPWIRAMGLADEAVATVNRESVEFFLGMRDRAQAEDEDLKIVVSGCLGPLGDAYAKKDADGLLESAKEAYAVQVKTLVEAGADMLSIMTVSSRVEALAATLLAREANAAIFVSFTVETDGKLIDGRTAHEFIRDLDGATDGYPAYYGINCAHPTHFLSVLETMEESSRGRIKEIRVNASEKSHAQLDDSEELDRGDISAVRGLHEQIGKLLDIKVVGGCCGTDEEHVAEMAKALVKS